MGVVDSLKDAVKLAQQLGSVEIAQSLIDAQQSALDMMEQNRALKEEVAQLKQALELKGAVNFHGGAYWHEVEGKRDGLFCSKCWDVNQKLVRIHHNTEQWFHCPSCEQLFVVPDGPDASPPSDPPGFVIA